MIFLEGLTSITNSSLLILAEQPFAIEKEMVNFGFAQFNSIFTMFTSIGITLIVVKFLKKKALKCMYFGQMEMQM